MSNELIELKIEATLPSFITNFEEVKTQVQERLKIYDVNVSLQNLQEAKKLATELNFFAKAINEKRIKKQKEASAPIEILKSQADELIRLFNESREKLLSQIKVFEDEKRNICLRLLQEELEFWYKEKNIENEFKTVKVDDLAILSNLTDTDNLSKKAKNEVISRVNQVLATQMLVKSRLLNLENACLKAGLTSLLERKHIESFLKEPEEVYNAKLQSLIETEVKRQAEIEARLLKQEEERLKKEAEIRVREEMQKQIQEQQKEVKPEALVQKVEQEEAISSPTPVITQAQTPIKPNILDELEEPRKQRFTITAHFEIECTGESEESLKEKYSNKLKNFKTFTQIIVKKTIKTSDKLLETYAQPQTNTQKPNIMELSRGDYGNV